MSQKSNTNQDEYKTEIDNMFHMMLSYNDNSIPSKSTINATISIKNEEDVRKINNLPIIAVMGESKCGKSFVIQKMIDSDYCALNNLGVKFCEVSPNFEFNIFKQSLIIIYIFNSYGLCQQKKIETIYKLKRKESQLVVIFNFHYIFKLTTSCRFEQKFMKINTASCIKKQDLPIAYVDKLKDNLIYYMLYNNLKHNDLMFHYLGQFIKDYSTHCSLNLFNNKGTNLNVNYKPEYDYFVDKRNNKFIIAIELCGEVKDLKLEMELKDYITTFTITGTKYQGIYSDPLKNKGPFEIKFNVLYESAPILTFTPIDLYEYKDGIAQFSIDILNNRYQQITL